MSDNSNNFPGRDRKPGGGRLTKSNKKPQVDAEEDLRQNFSANMKILSA